MISEIAEVIRFDRYMWMVKKYYSFLLKERLNGSFLGSIEISGGKHKS